MKNVDLMALIQLTSHLIMRLNSMIEMIMTILMRNIREDLNNLDIMKMIKMRIISHTIVKNKPVVKEKNLVTMKKRRKIRRIKRIKYFRKWNQ